MREFRAPIDLTLGTATAMADISGAKVILVTFPDCSRWYRVGMTRKKAAERQIIMSVPQVAARWSVSPGEVLHLCLRGELAHHRIGDLIRIRFRDIEAYEARQREQRSEPGIA